MMLRIHVNARVWWHSQTLHDPDLLLPSCCQVCRMSEHSWHRGLCKDCCLQQRQRLACWPSIGQKLQERRFSSSNGKVVKDLNPNAKNDSKHVNWYEMAHSKQSSYFAQKGNKGVPMSHHLVGPIFWTQLRSAAGDDASKASPHCWGRGTENGMPCHRRNAVKAFWAMQAAAGNHTAPGMLQL